MKSGSLNLLEQSGPVQACYRDCFIRVKIKTSGELENKETAFLKPLVLQTKEAADN
jgi:hypothetical protein